jgi:hypothetical protein
MLAVRVEVSTFDQGPVSLYSPRLSHEGANFSHPK